MIAVTGANGRLGQLTVEALVRVMPAKNVVATVRDLGKADKLRALGVEVREADYDRPDTLATALEGVDKVLLISSSMPGDRLRQHKAAIDAAKAAGVRLLAYTSVLRAATSSLWLAGEHRETEDCLKSSGLNHVLLRYGWYIENNTDALPAALAGGEIVGTSGAGRFSALSRADCAAAAVSVLTQPGHDGRKYEIAGEQAYTIPDLAHEVSRQLGRTIAYREIAAPDYEAMLRGFGLPELMVRTVVDAETRSRDGEFYSDSDDLSTLIGRRPITMAEVVRSSLSR